MGEDTTRVRLSRDGEDHRRRVSGKVHRMVGNNKNTEVLLSVHGVDSVEAEAVGEVTDRSSRCISRVSRRGLEEVGWGWVERYLLVERGWSVARF